MIISLVTVYYDEHIHYFGERAFDRKEIISNVPINISTDGMNPSTYVK